MLFIFIWFFYLQKLAIFLCFGLIWLYGISTIVDHPMPNQSLYTVPFQTFQFTLSILFKCQKQFYFKLFSLVKKVQWFQVFLCITNNPIKHQSFIHTQLNIKTVLFQTIQFSINTQFSSIWPIDRTLSSTTNPGQSEPGSDGNKEVLHIPQSSSITGASSSDCFVSYPGHLLGKSYLYAEKQLVYSTAPTN